MPTAAELNALTVADLRKLAAGAGIKGRSKLKKAGLVRAMANNRWMGRWPRRPGKKRIAKSLTKARSARRRK